MSQVDPALNLTTSPSPGRSIAGQVVDDHRRHRFVRLGDGPAPARGGRSAQVNIFSRDEAKQDLMRRAFNDERMRFFLGDVRDADSVRAAVTGADFVFHAAALKQVPSCEFFPQQAVKTNVVGSHNVIETAAAGGVRSRRVPEHRQGGLPGQRHGHVEGAHGEDRAGLRAQQPRLAT